MADRFKKPTRIFELALSDAIQSHSRVHNAEKGPSRCITGEAKMISPAEEEMQHLTTKPKVKLKKSSNFVLHHDPKSSLPPRRYNSKHCHASYQSSCDSSGAVSDIDSISSEEYRPKIGSGSIPTSRTLAPVKDQDSISSIYALPISFCETKQPGIGCDNPTTIDPPNSNQSILKRGTELCSLSFATRNHLGSFPKKVSMQVGFGASEVNESHTGKWDMPSKCDSIIPAPKSSESFSNSFFSPNDVEPSNGRFSIPSPKGCNQFLNSALFVDKISPVNYDTDIPSQKGYDSNPFFTCPDQMHATASDAFISPPKSCGSKFVPLTDRTHSENCDIPSLDIHSNSIPFINMTDCEIVRPGSKVCRSNYFPSANQARFGTDEATIPGPKSFHVTNPMHWSDQKIPSPKSYKSFPYSKSQTNKIYSENCDTEIFPPSQSLGNCGLDLNKSIRQKPAGIYASNNSTPESDSQKMPSLANDNKDWSELALNEQHITTCDVFPGDYLDELISTETMSLDSSMNERNSLEKYIPNSDVTALSSNYKPNDCLPKSACKVNKEVPLETYDSTNEKQAFKSWDVAKQDRKNLIDFEETLDPHKNLNVSNVNHSDEKLIGDSDSNCDYRHNHTKVINDRTLHPVKSHFNWLSFEPNSNSDSCNHQSKVDFVTPIKSRFDLLSIEPKSSSNSWIDQLKDIHISTDQSHLDLSSTEPIKGTNYFINQSKGNRAISLAQTHLNVLIAKPKSCSAILVNEPYLSGPNNNLNNSGFDLNESTSKSYSEDNIKTESRKELLKRPSKSIDSGLGFLSEENLTCSSSDIPSAVSESELNISLLTRKENPDEDLVKKKAFNCYEEDYSTPLRSSKFDAYVESEKERINNLIDQFIGM